MAESRIPTQKRSIEKRNKIIEKGFELMCEKGYHNISTPDIANAACVSTGIIYQYFNDKKEIFIEGCKYYSENILYPMLNLIDNSNNLETIINDIIDAFINNHITSKKAHEEIMAMSHLYSDVEDIFLNFEIKLTNKIINLIGENNISNINEKTHIFIGLIENLCHEIIYHQHSNLNYDIMKKETINIILYILKSK